MEDPEETYQSIRRAAEVHRQVRRYARKVIKPGMSMIDIVETIEDGTRALVEENGFESGIGFPTGVSLNHCGFPTRTLQRFWRLEPRRWVLCNRSYVCSISWPWSLYCVVSV